MTDAALQALVVGTLAHPPGPPTARRRLRPLRQNALWGLRLTHPRVIHSHHAPTTPTPDRSRPPRPGQGPEGEDPSRSARQRSGCIERPFGSRQQRAQRRPTHRARALRGVPVADTLGPTRPQTVTPPPQRAPAAGTGHLEPYTRSSQAPPSPPQDHWPVAQRQSIRLLIGRPLVRIQASQRNTATPHIRTARPPETRPS